METPPPGLGMPDKFRRTGTVGEKTKATVSKATEIKAKDPRSSSNDLSGILQGSSTDLSGVYQGSTPDLSPILPASSPDLAPVLPTSTPYLSGILPASNKHQHPETRKPRPSNKKSLEPVISASRNQNSGLALAKPAKMSHIKMPEALAFSVGIYLEKHARPSEPFNVKQLSVLIGHSHSKTLRVLNDLAESGVVEQFAKGKWRYLG